MPTIDTRAEAIELAAEACLHSDQLVLRALDWVGTNGRSHSALVEHIVDYYVDSPQFATWVVDVADGEDAA
jgi:hypothetical protein